MAANKIETFGSPLSEIVEKQLAYRSQFNLKGIGYTGESKILLNFDPTQKQYIDKQLFNSAWINLISSVNNTDPDAQDTDKDSNLAKRLVLSGGALAWDGSKLVKRDQVKFSNPEDGSSYGKEGKYNWNSQTGVRPMPGITGFKIISKNLNGTIREATIDFNVWSLPELEDIEKLYLRPGYHIIVEWGHTYGLDGEGNPTSFPLDPFANYATFFETTPADKIYEIIEQAREKNFGNYDAFLGIIKNFSWSFRPDGGYDCSISVISKGEVLESLTVRSGLPSADETVEKATEEDFFSTNLLTKFTKLITSVNIGSKNEEVQVYYDNIEFTAQLQKIKYGDALSYLKEYSNGKDSPIAFRKNITTKTPFWSLIPFVYRTETLSFVYVKLETILFFINKHIQISTTSKKNGTFNLESTQDLFVFDKYINIAPHECIIPVDGTDSELFIVDGIGIVTTSIFPFFKVDIPTSTRILDILISLDFFLTELKTFIESSEDPEEFDIISFVKTFLKKLETCTGGINEFDLEFSEEKNQYTVIDRRYQEEKDAQTIPVLSVYGSNSIALDLNIQTKITNKLGSQISIAAQGPDADAQFNSSMPEFKKWNKNLIDRFDPFEKSQSSVGENTVLAPPKTGNNTVLSPENSQGSFTSAKQVLQFNIPKPSTKNLGITRLEPIQQEESIQERVDKFYLKLKQAYRQWWSGKFQPEENYWHSIKTQGQTIYTMIASDFNTSKGLPPQGIIPTVISLKIDGIGGIKIGQTFRINKGILPKRYDDFGYIVTGIEHSIENNKWTTQINAQTYYIGKPSAEEKQKALDRLKRFTPFGSGGSSPSAPAGGQDTSFTPSDDDLKKQAKVKAEEYLGRPISEKEWRLLIAATSAEASSNAEEQAWVAAVILNRSRTGSIEGTLYAKNQFQAVTGTSANNNQPSPNFTKGPTKLRENSIYRSFNNFLNKNTIETSYINFTAADLNAYGPGTNPDYLTKLKNSKDPVTKGGTVFAKRI